MIVTGSLVSVWFPGSLKKERSAKLIPLSDAERRLSLIQRRKMEEVTQYFPEKIPMEISGEIVHWLKKVEDIRKNSNIKGISAAS